MDTNYVVIFLILFVSCCFLYVIARLINAFQQSNRIEERLDAVIEHAAIVDGQPSVLLGTSHREKSGIDKIFQIESELIQSLVGRMKNLSKVYQTQFEQAGWSNSNAPVIVLSIRIGALIVGLLICIGLYVLKDEIMPKNKFFGFLIYVAIMYISFKSYDFGIKHIINKRYERIQNTLSFSVDLLSICVRAGYSLDRAFEIIAEEISYYNIDLCIEFMKVSIELTVIPDRKEALRNFSRRVDLPLTKILVTGLIQSEEQGASMGQTLTHLSQDFSKQKIAEIDERASKIPTKILLPMAVFCLPGFLLFLMGPVIANIARSSFMN
jgi:tight adherence protein C